ncbi:MAG: lactonase family protein [Verrucomicrobia bacterium]|nr:lactonase family protein [Verrucomicrobiota bacterium]
MHASDATKYFAYIGTYTASGKSQGIYVARFDTATGKLGAPELVAETKNPSFLAIHPNRKFLYAIGELASVGGKKGGAVSAFAIDAATGKLTPLNQASSGGPGPCHVSVDKTGKCVLTASYGGGSCSVLPIKEDGSLAEPSCVVQHVGSSVNPKRQAGPHAHQIVLDAANRFVFVPDLGLDKVMIYKFDAARGCITPNDPAFATVPPGSGPRHIAFHPSQKFAYVINEMLCTMTAFRYDTERGAFTEIETVSTLPASESVQAGYSTAEVEVHPNGKFLYGSNRGHDTIAVFTIAEDGKIKLIQNEPTQGKMPRHFTLDPTGRWLLAEHQSSDSIVLFSVDQQTGKLKPTGQTVEVGSPVCIQFLPVK